MVQEQTDQMFIGRLRVEHKIWRAARIYIGAANVEILPTE